MAQDLTALQKMKNRIKEDQYYYKELARERAEKERQIQEENLSRQVEAERANRASMWENNPVAAMFSSEPKVHQWTPEDYEREVAAAEASQKATQERKPAQAPQPQQITPEMQASIDRSENEHFEHLSAQLKASGKTSPEDIKKYMSRKVAGFKPPSEEVEREFAGYMAWQQKRVQQTTHSSDNDRLAALNAGGQRFVAVGEEGSKHIIPVDYLRR